jgi:hypothetical protein
MYQNPYPHRRTAARISLVAIAVAFVISTVVFSGWLTLAIIGVCLVISACIAVLVHWAE